MMLQESVRMSACFNNSHVSYKGNVRNARSFQCLGMPQCVTKPRLSFVEGDGIYRLTLVNRNAFAISINILAANGIAEVDVLWNLVVSIFLLHSPCVHWEKLVAR